jgi:hypothetical protein
LMEILIGHLDIEQSQSLNNPDERLSRATNVNLLQ